jgi:hypothetical protein
MPPPATLSLYGVVLRRIPNAPVETYIGAWLVRPRGDAKFVVMIDDDFGGWTASLSIDGDEHLLERGATAVEAARKLDQRLDAGDARLAAALRGRRPR